MATEQWKKDNADKMREYRRRHYYKNKGPYINRAKKGKQMMKEWYYELKSHFVCACGEEHIACLLFHHRDPNEKDFAVADALRLGYGKKRIESEIAKCDIMCSNCHLKLHHQIRHKLSHDEQFNKV